MLYHNQNLHFQPPVDQLPPNPNQNIHFPAGNDHLINYVVPNQNAHFQPPANPLFPVGVQPPIDVADPNQNPLDNLYVDRDIPFQPTVNDFFPDQNVPLQVPAYEHSEIYENTVNEHGEGDQQEEDDEEEDDAEGEERAGIFEGLFSEPEGGDSNEEGEEDDEEVVIII